MASNTPYQEDNSLIPRITGMSLVTGAGVGLYKYKTSPTFRDKITNAINKISVLKEEERSHTQDAVDIAYKSTRSGEQKSREIHRNDILRMDQMNSYTDYDKYSFDSLTGIWKNGPEAINPIKFNGIESITDMHGNQIGNKLVDTYLGRMGLDRSNIHGDIEVDGTSIKFKTHEGGFNIEEHSIPVWKNTGNNIWINQDGSSWVGQLVDHPTKSANGKIVSQVIDPNTNLLINLADDTRFNYMLKQYGGGKDAKTIARDVLNKSVDELSGEYRAQAYQMKRFMNVMKQSYSQYTSGMDIDTDAAFASRNILLDPVSAKKIGRVEQMGSNTATFGGKNEIGVLYKHNIEGYYNHISSVRKGEDKLLFGEFRGGKIVPVTKLSASNQSHLHDIQSNISNALSQSQTGQGTTTYFKTMGDFIAPEALKSVKGYYFTDDPVQLGYSVINGSSYKSVSRIKPQYEFPHISGLEKMVSKLSSRGHINVPAILSPYSEEMIGISSKVKNMTIAKNLDIELTELITGTGGEESNDFAKMIKQLMENPEMSVADDFYLEMNKGTVLGRKYGSSNLKTLNEYELNKTRPLGVVKTNKNIFMTKEHWNRTIERNIDKLTGRNTDAPWILHVGYKDNMIKAGTFGGTIRGSVVDLNENINFKRFTGTSGKALLASKNFALAPEAELSSDLFKNVLIKESDGKIIYGKGRGEYLSFLRSSILGNLHMSGTEMSAEGEMLNLFKEFTDIGDLTSLSGSNRVANLTQLQRNHGITFKGNRSIEEMIPAYEKMFAMTRVADISGKQNRILSRLPKADQVDRIINRTFTALDLRSKFTPDQIEGKSLADLPDKIRNAVEAGEINLEDLNEYKYLFSMAPHEAESYTLGVGSGVYRMSAMDLSFAHNMPAALEELSVKNQVYSTKIAQESKMMFSSLAGELGPGTVKEFEKTTGVKLETLGVDELREQLGNAWMWNDTSNAMKDPRLFLSSLFGEKNTNGFLIKTLDNKGVAGNFYIPSGEWFGGIQQLTDGTYKPARDESYIIARALSDAARKDGVISGNTYSTLSAELGRNYSSIARASDMRVEGREYEKLVDNQFMINIKRKLDQLGSDVSKELNYTLGSISLVSKREMASNIATEIEDAQKIALANGSKTLAVLEHLYGKDNAITSAIRNTARSEWTPYEIGQEVAEKSANTWESVKSEVGSIIDQAINQKGQIEKEHINKIKSVLFKEGDVSFITRYPVIYEKSILKTFGFAANELGNDRSIALGHIIKSLIAGDTDGDAIHKLSLWSAANRAEAQEHFEKQNRLAYQYMANQKEISVLKTFTKEKDKYTSIGDALAGNYAEMIKSLEKEQSNAAALTKGLTGTATVRAWGQMGYYDKMITDNKELSRDAYEAGRTFINTFIPKTGPQAFISSKHARSIVDKLSKQGYTTMDAVLENIGNVTNESIDRSVRELGEVHNLLEWAITASHKPGVELDKELVNDVKALHSWQTHWRRLEDQEIESIHNRGWFNKEGENLTTFSQRVRDAEKDIKFWNEDKLLQQAGLVNDRNAIDFLSRPVHEGVTGTSSYSSMLAKVRNEYERKNLSAAKYADEINRVAFSRIGESELKKALGSDALLDTVFRDMAYIGQRRTIPLLDKAAEIAKTYATPRNLMLGAGAALLGFTALNLLTGDGTPKDLNDLPSYNNPSFHNTRYNNYHDRQTMMTAYGTNTSSSLLTDYNTPRPSLMGYINNIVGLRGYNSSTVISDGSNPYKADMYQYSN